MKIFRFEDYTILNESFQSSKLKTIIQQHGMPRWKEDKRFLYDVQDNDIFGVMDYDDWHDWYHDKHADNKHSYRIELEDGTYLVLGNMETFKKCMYDDNFDEEISKRINDRHKGNEFRDSSKNWEDRQTKDKTVKHFETEKKKILTKHAIEQFKSDIGDQVKEFTTIIRKKIEDYIDKNKYDYDFKYTTDDNRIDLYDYSGSDDFDFQMEFDDKKYYVCITFDYLVQNLHKDGGAFYYDMVFTPDTITIFLDSDVYEQYDESEINAKEFINDNDFGKEFWQALFKDYVLEELEGKIFDKYAYYGVSRGDFF